MTLSHTFEISFRNKMESIYTNTGDEKRCELIKEEILQSNSPKVFQKMIDTWPVSKWTLNEFTSIFGSVVTKFKFLKKLSSETFSNDNHNKKRRTGLLTTKRIPLENECIYVSGTFEDFQNWLDSSPLQRNKELENYDRSNFWCYSDYNYMPELFSQHREVLDDVDWGVFGYPERNGVHSAIWIGSEESYTPCHQDTYGLNLVAQICGVKRWLLLPPEESAWLKATRIPYEESSVFTEFAKERLKNNEKCIQIELKPGEVLLVPKHWWHYVESLVPSISINTWIELDNDANDRLKEALVQSIVYGMKTSESCPIDKWINPKQEVPSSIESCLMQVQMALEDKLKRGGNEVKPHEITNDMLINCLCDTHVLDKLVAVMEQRLLIDQ